MTDADKSFIEEISIKELMQAKAERTYGYKPNMRLAVLKRNATIAEWLRGYKPRTQGIYLGAMDRLLTATNKTPEELRDVDAPTLKRLGKSMMGDLVSQDKRHPAKTMMKTLVSFAATMTRKSSTATARRYASRHSSRNASCTHTKYRQWQRQQARYPNHKTHATMRR